VRVGFLGLLHMDIVRERLVREYDLDLVVTNRRPITRSDLLGGKELILRARPTLPDPAKIKEIREPWIKGESSYLKTMYGFHHPAESRQGAAYRKTSAMFEDRARRQASMHRLANLLTDFS